MTELLMDGTRVIVRTPPAPQLIVPAGVSIVASAPAGRTVSVTVPDLPRFVMDTPDPRHVLVPARGLPGADGAPGTDGVDGADGAPGPQNLYVQQAAPTFTQNGVWLELNPDETVKTIWAETGF